LTTRQELLEKAEQEIFDVAIIGGGINGACTYDHLCRAGYSVLLLDKGDFAGATSQASGMMIWGGLLYLKNLDFATVYSFSRARDRMIATMQERVAPTSYRYIASRRGERSRHFVHLGLYLYWMLGHFRRHRPFSETSFPELQMIREDAANGSLLYEESMLRRSDSRFVLDWITPHLGDGQVPLNYCAMESGSYSNRERLWRLDLSDRLSSRQLQAKARLVINCAGIWTDSVNDTFGIDAPYRHLFGKGVYISTPRPEQHNSPLVFEMGNNGDTLTYVPWGPISMWGPTETYTSDIEEGFRPEAEDVHFLLEKMNRNLKSTTSASDIVSIRCGVRPLAVPRGSNGSAYPLDISRRTRISFEREKGWITLHGGKLTGCTLVAADIAGRVAAHLPPGKPRTTAHRTAEIETTMFPGMGEEVPSIDWCRKHEFCHSLDDYLRRRTNIAQWVRREGLGNADENAGYLKSLAMTLSGGDELAAERELSDYRKRVHERFDQLIARI